MTDRLALNVALARVVRGWREEHGISQGELAARSGITPGLVGRVERGRMEPSFRTVGRLLEGMEMGLTELAQLLERERRAGEG